MNKDKEKENVWEGKYRARGLAISEGRKEGERRKVSAKRERERPAW